MNMGFIESVRMNAQGFGAYIRHIDYVLSQEVEGLYSDLYQVYHIGTKFTTASTEEPYFRVQPLLNYGYEPES